MKITEQKSFGFSLIETIVAIAILSVAIVAPLTLSQKGLSGARYAKDQVTAFYLAQEAIEYARNIRDNNYYLGRSQTSSWLSGLDVCINNLCGIDVTANSGQQVSDCSTDPKGCLLTFDPSVGAGLYGEAREGNGNPMPGLQDAIFTRTLRITPFSIGSDTNAGATLTATVLWKSGLVQRSIVVSEKIFNWHPAPVN